MGVENNIRIISESLYLFIMPVFFSLSGYLFKKPDDFKRYYLVIKKKAFNLLVPYVVFSIIYILMNQVGGKDNIYTWRSLLNIYRTPISYLWFLYTLFLIFVLVGFLSLFRISIETQLFLYLILFLIIKITRSNLYILTTFGWAIFFCLGVVFKKNIKLIKNKYTLCGSLILTLLLICMMFINLGLNHELYNNVSIINIIPKIISDIFMFSLFLNLRESTKFFKYFEKYGRYSLIVYMVHAPVMSASRAIILKLIFPNMYILAIIVILIGWYASLATIYLSNHFKTINFIFNAYNGIINLKNK